MIATYHAQSSLFVPLPNRVPLSNSTMFYSSIQLTNVRIRLGDHLSSVVRFSDQYEDISELLVQSRHEVAFSQLTHEHRSTWFGQCQSDSSLEQ